ncbi:Transcription-repair coupling factor [uncultured delta proteobacterium]|uniref:Transcription-repair-coupling factor n=1 Tax=uncultured delta proteobacterium TaxID=34034 RepID=A0A212J1L0_9DELT|nr:Transcription-repair coupling factor [uncultured delta proteobacterium]
MAFDAIIGSLLGGTKQAAHISRSGPATRARLAARLLSRGRNVVLVTRDAKELNTCRALIRLFLAEHSATEAAQGQAVWNDPILVLPPFSPGQKSPVYWADRMAALYTLSQKKGPVPILVPVDGLLPLLPPTDFFTNHELRLTKGVDMDPELVLEQLVGWGYTRVPMVSSPGEIAMRGDILDIACPGYPKPVRLEFFGDTLDDIRIFDGATQRSVTDIPEVTLIPVSPFLLDGNGTSVSDPYWKTLLKDGTIDDEDIRILRRVAGSGGKDLLPGMAFPDASRLGDWLPKDAIFLLPDAQNLAQAVKEIAATWEMHLDEDRERTGLNQPRQRVLHKTADVLASFENRDRAYCDDLIVAGAAASEDLPERAIHSFQELFPAATDVERPWQRLVAAMREWASPRKEGEYGSVLLAFATERGRAKFLALAEQDGIRPQLRYTPDEKGLFALVSPFRGGAHLVWDKTLILGEDVLQPRSDRGTHRSGGEAFRGLERYDDLKDGDLLVHRDYGLGRFAGLHHMDLGGVSNDYMLLIYAGDDKLYLPVDRMALVQRYKAPDGTVAAPDKLGGSQWFSSKEKARKAIEKIAGDLVEMYAYRKVAKGFTYHPVSEMYREFEASFGFEETPDQARAIQDVLNDMEKPEPMDRLVCGDVGFGKTEVAMRASFRAALEGRQVALLCPTTILAEQHFQTFKARLANFPVNVAMLSRFVSPAKQKEILASAAKGQVDILIGTHRLLSKDVALPNLGLLVLDEEQRFGVRHKERLKQMRKNVDVLTLTATPIPRTLQLSLSGIRELSVIETPPPDRKPVTTAIINRQDETLKVILEREIARKGQVFWVYNRVQGLERVAEYVQKLVPGARVGMAHGQMSERALEDAMHKFWHAELDVLVCTAIVESGLDFPRANTLIVDQAQLFGLGQLYQLRGRVGRSDVQAFSVFVVNDVDKLAELARQRLRIILDLDYLGAGFQVAMEDLRLRGTGNILGESQSGHMTRLGLDLFLEMLEEAVAKLKGGPIEEEITTEITLGIAAHIPDDYIEDPKTRLQYYKSLSSAVDGVAQQDIELEMRDRFGPWPEPVANFLAVLVFKRFLGGLGALKADLHPDRVRLVFAEKSSALDPEKLIKWVTASPKKARFLPPAGLEVVLPEGAVSERFSFVQTELSSLRKAG